MMTMDATTVLIILATAFSGIVAGASLDQPIKQLLSRHKIGAKAYSTYTRQVNTISYTPHPHGRQAYGILFCTYLLNARLVLRHRIRLRIFILVSYPFF
jgi:hypothetical protein